MPQAKIKYIGINLRKEVKVLGKKCITEGVKSLYNKYFEKIQWNPWEKEIKTLKFRKRSHIHWYAELAL